MGILNDMRNKRENVGGYIGYSFLINGTYSNREKVNYPEYYDFIRKVDLLKHNTADWEPDKEYEARFDIYDKTGRTIVTVIYCCRDDIRMLKQNIFRD